MAIQSMTGFARHEGEAPGCRYVWELRSVNGKGLDLRLRLPPGFEALEQPVRKAAAAELSRGNVQITLSVSGTAPAMEAVVNETALEAVIELVNRLGERIDARKPALDGLLNIRGVLEFRDPELSDADRTTRDEAVLAGFVAALGELKAMRLSEGAALNRVLRDQIDRIEAFTLAVEADPSRSPEAIRARLADQVSALMDTGAGLDRDRLHMEAALIATKADLREEIDRLKAHVEAARTLIEGEGGAGRRLDFLAQEFNRETNTICSKSNAASVTAIGLDLKVLIDQFREQIQNLE
ncbi:TIGR00255 family protein [Hoeflea phototrophica DFL-43]|uniref:TIGR00255 family protein n=1 Tax=Hoeflea phototrophica (strain DSM 17068 / NCIMB 14078 / DFL-43) TaxID=411684 RepID=A9D455_HOEPD|nr:YicC/YloC family endoribonuclease [Hoeflea phototrophica]EDQ33815.1 TIGR00255 family protein [Hoeflea phototrophica DFL-43]